MSEALESKTQTGLTSEQILVLTSLRVAIKPSVWHFWQEAMPDGPEVVDVAVASIDIDKNGIPVAIGVRRSELTRTINEEGDSNTPEAKLIAIEPDRVVKFTADASHLWSILDINEIPQSPHSREDPFDSNPY